MAIYWRRFVCKDSQLPFHVGEDVLSLCRLGQIQRLALPSAHLGDCLFRGADAGHIGVFPQPVEQTFCGAFPDGVFSVAAKHKNGVLFLAPGLFLGTLWETHGVAVLFSQTKFRQGTDLAPGLSVGQTDRSAQLHQRLCHRAALSGNVPVHLFQRPFGLPALVRGPRGASAFLRPPLQPVRVPGRQRRKPAYVRETCAQHAVPFPLLPREPDKQGVGAIRRCVSNC